MGRLIFVKTLTNQTFTVKVNEVDKIEDIKRKIYEKEGIPEDQQRLLKDGKQLVDGGNMKDYGIMDKSTVHMVLRLR